MQGPHRTILTYFWGKVDANGDEPQIEVGEVTCVPRVGEGVYIEKAKSHFVVESVSWTPDPGGLPITWVGVVLVVKRKRKRRTKGTR